MVTVGGTTGGAPYIRLGDLDYTALRQSLRDYLAGAINPATGQGYFSDYDLEGSALSTLLDLLAYNSTLYGFYANMIANESFLDTAQTDDAINSLVKPLSYLPTSRRGARAQITVESSDGASHTIKPGDLFTGGGLKWTPSTTFSVPASGSVSIELYQGQFVELFVEQADATNRHQKYEIPSSFIDTTTLEVYVDEGSGQVQWTDVREVDGNITGLDGNSEVYFLTTSNNERYAFYFGDNFVGKTPVDGSPVYVKYYETAGDAGNGVVSFVSNTGGVRVTGTEIASGAGTLREDIESVRKNAPLFFQTQGRYVTAQDHRVGLLQEESGLVANVWGGEENDPPNYGRVYVSALGGDGSSLTENAKRRILALMKEKGVVTILPAFVDPNPIDISIRGNVFYDPTLTGSDPVYLEGVIREYAGNYLTSDFNVTFNFPAFSVGLNALDEGIVGETLGIYLVKRIEYDDETIMTVNVPFKNTLADSGNLPGTVIQTPSPFLRLNEEDSPELVYLIDDGYGGIRMYRDSDGSFVEEVGSINYSTGTLQIDGLRAIQSFDIEARPRSNTILSTGQNLLSTVDGGINLVSVS